MSHSRLVPSGPNIPSYFFERATLCFLCSSVTLRRSFFLWRCSWMILLMVPREGSHLVLSSHIELCGSSSIACWIMRIFCMSVTATGYPALGRPALWSDVSSFQRLKRSIHLYTIMQWNRRLAIYTLIKSDWILIASSSSLNRVKTYNRICPGSESIFFFFRRRRWDSVQHDVITLECRRILI